MAASLTSYLSGSSSSTTKHDIKDKVDPISFLALTALMKFKECRTRMSISSDHSIKTQEPSQYSFLWINWLGPIRYFQGDSREDLDVINSSIEKTALIFNPTKGENKHIKDLFDHAVAGIDAIQQSYQGKSTVTGSALEKWKGLIKTACEKGIDADSSIDEQAEIIKKLWDKEEIEIVNSILTLLNKESVNKLAGRDLKIHDLKRDQNIALLEQMIQQKADLLNEIYRK